jgi:hypothetical protein
VSDLSLSHGVITPALFNMENIYCKIVVRRCMNWEGVDAGLITPRGVGGGLEMATCALVEEAHDPLQSIDKR